MITEDQILADQKQYREYVKEMKRKKYNIIPKTFSQMFGYEIFLYPKGGYDIKGTRVPNPRP